MPIQYEPFDCTLNMRSWQHDPDRDIVDSLLAMTECYSRDFRRMVCEIRRLEGIVHNSPKDRRSSESEYAEIQSLIDSQIAALDPDRE